MNSQKQVEQRSIYQKKFSYRVTYWVRFLQAHCSGMDSVLFVGNDMWFAEALQHVCKQVTVCKTVKELPESSGLFDFVCVASDVFTAENERPVEDLLCLKKYCHRQSRIVLVRLTKWGAWLNRRYALSTRACAVMLRAAGYEPVSAEYGFIRVGNDFLNDLMGIFLAKIIGLRQLCHFQIYTLGMTPEVVVEKEQLPSVSIIIPCRNEAGTVMEMIGRMPQMGSHTELICIEGHSRDNTEEMLHAAVQRYPHLSIIVATQTGKGKGNAVVEACARARGDILMIFDGDMTIAPEDMQVFYDVMVSGRGELLNGSRLLLPYAHEAMRWPNWFANHGFAYGMSLLLGQKVTDTLCGTKVCWRRDYERMRALHPKLWELDPFGDFAWLLGAALSSRKIVDIPIKYRARIYGQPLQGCFGYGLQLCRLAWYAALVRIFRWRSF